jgi:NADH-quinone oxidoreductase subunit C
MSRVEATARAIEARIGARAAPLPALPGEIAIEVAPPDLVAICKELRDAPDLAFEQLIDLSGIDYLDYGRSEWTTEAATTTGFSRGV